MPTTIGPSGEGLTFLLGLPRSGTTLLSVMLDGHPEVASPPEPWIMLALHELGRVGVRHPANAPVLGTAVRTFAPPERLRAAAAAAARTLYQGALDDAGKRILVDKTPRYLLIPEYLAEVFPAARFLWLLRDPLDVAASYRDTWNFNLAEVLAGNHDQPELFDLPIGLERLEAFRDRHPGAVHVVHYERLVEDTAGTMAGVLRHLGLDPDPAVITRMSDLAGARREGQLGDPKILRTTAPHRNSVGRWGAVFDPAELQVLLDAVGAERLARLGYAGTVATLAAMDVRESAPDAWRAYRARAEERLRARLDDIARATSNDGELPAAVQPRVHAALAGDEAWCALAEETLAEERARDAAEIARLRAELADRDRRLAALLASTSWRITAPLRRVIERLRG